MAVLLRSRGKEIPLAIFEFKYLNSINNKPFNDDIVKVLNYIQYDELCKFYLGFIQEVEYEIPDDFSWLSEEQRLLSNGRITELSGGFFKPGAKKSSWLIKEHKIISDGL